MLVLHSFLLPNNIPLNGPHLFIHSVCLFVCLIFGLFLLWVHYEEHCYEYICVSFSTDLCFHFSCYIPRSRTAGSTVLNLLKNCQTDFRSGCTSLYSHQQCMRMAISPHSHTTAVCRFYYNCPSRYEVAPHCGFNLHFLDS